MTKLIELLVMGLGGLSLFVCAFLGFAAMSGTPLSELAVIGPMFAEEEGPEVDLAAIMGEPEKSGVISTAKQVIEANLSLLEMYALQPPFSAEELQALALDLKTAKLGYEERMRKLDDREISISEREELLTDQFQTLEEIRDDLERMEEDLNLRSAEVATDETAQSETDAARWKTVSGLFTDADPEELLPKLMSYDPQEAALILSNLPKDRATLLLNSIPEPKWKDYVEAFSSLNE